MIKMNKLPLFAVLIFILPLQSYADRIKDLASVAGVRENQLLGYGLVVGLVIIIGHA